MRLPADQDIREMAEWFLLALCLWREARGEPLEGKAAVADVILTRVADPRWPNTISGVITQRYQFSAFNKHDPNVTKFPIPDEDEWTAFVDCAAVAHTAIAQGPSMIADHYYAATMERTPEWTFKMRRVGQIGGHIFLDSKKQRAEDVGD